MIKNQVANPCHLWFGVANSEQRGPQVNCGTIYQARKGDAEASETISLQNVWLSDPIPNPAKDEVRFDYTLPKGNNASIKIFDAMRTTQVEELTLGDSSSSLQLNLKNFHSGIYVIKLVVEGRPLVTKKLSIIK